MATKAYIDIPLEKPKPPQPPVNNPYTGIRIYCSACRQYILDASPQFVPGGPYHGAMFQRPRQTKLRGNSYFKFVEGIRGGNLYCPRCDNAFIKRDGELITEHGILRSGQRTIDKRIKIIHPDLRLKNLNYSGEADLHRVEDAAKERQRLIQEIFDQEAYEKLQEDTQIRPEGPVIPEAEPEPSDEEKRQKRQKRVKTLRNKGYSYAKIAKKVGVSMSTVIKDLKR